MGSGGRGTAAGSHVEVSQGGHQRHEPCKHREQADHPSLLAC